MKMAKKVLSVVLAVIMALSCFAVAASAWGSESADHKVKVSLGLSTGEVEWTTKYNSKTKKYTVDKAITDDPELAGPEDGKNIYAEPGEIVWVYQTLETNYYVFGYQSHVFFDARLIDAYTDFCNQTASLTNSTSMTTTHQGYVHQYNEFEVDDDACGTAIGLGFDNVQTAAWGQYVGGNIDGADAWPTDDSGNILSDFAKNGAADTDKWHYNKMGVFMNEGSEWGQIFDGSTWLIRFPLRVPSDAEDGTVYTITLPEGTLMRGAKKNGGTYCPEAEGEGDVSIEPCWEYPATANDAYWDLSDATVTITVGDGSSEPELDYTDLDKAIADFEGLTEADYTAESWTAADAAYDAAVAAKTDATTQDEIDAATKDLNDAMDALVEATKLDFSALDTALAKLPDEFEGYTTSSVDAVIDAADAARAAYDATTQDEIDAAAAALEEALEGLTAKANMAVLEEALAAAENVPDIADWYELSVEALEDAVAAGQAIIAQADEYTDQAAVNAAAAAINEILANHTYGVADYSALWALNELIAELDEANYTISSWTALETALGAVVPGLLQSKQDQVNEMIADVEAAFNGLKEKADTSRLERAIADVDAANEADYAAVVWASIQDMVATANTYVGADLAADDVQGDIDALTDNINEALLNTLDDADYSAVENAINRIPDDLSMYTEETVNAVIAAYDAVVRGLKEDQQVAVDKMAADINAAVDALKVQGADYEYVDKYVNQAATLNRDLYTADSLAALDSALAAVVRGLDITHQDEVTNMANDLYAALEGLEKKGADYTAVETALAKVPADSSLYTANSWAALETAIGAVVYGKTADEQADVDAMAEAIEIALEGLVDAGADYSAIEALLANAPTANQTKSYKSKIDNSTYEFNYYTVDSYAAFDAAKNAVELGKLISQQGDVDAWAEALEIAINGLVPAGAETYVNYFEGKKDMNPELYTAESWATYAAAKEEVLKYTVKDNWSKIGGGLSKAGTGYDAAYMALELKPVVVPADYTAFSAAIIEAAEVNKDMTPYTSASADAFYAAFNNAQLVPGNLTSDDQAIIDDATNALIAAINGLKYKADLTALNDALAAAYDKEADEDLYTEESWDVLVEAVAAGEAFTNATEELTAEDDQKAIDDAAAAILAAIDALEEKPVVVPANYDDLDEAIADAEALIAAGQGNYTDATWNDFVNAVTAGKLLSRDLTSDDQIAVDDATSAIIDAKTALEKKAAVYTVLDDVIANAEKLDKTPFTNDSVAALEEALAAAKAVARDLTADDQKTIDDAADALMDAMENLKVKTAEDELGHVKEVTYTPSVDPHNTYEVRVEGRPSMIQFMDSHGGTRSFDRYNDKVVSIKHYDKDGNEVGELSRKIAYEVWTVNTLLEEDTFTMRAKGNEETRWEPITGENGELYTFVNKYATPDAHFVSVKAPASGKKGAVMIDVVAVGDDVERIMVKNEGGDTVTCTLANGRIVKNADGTITGSLKGWASHDGENTITVKLYAGGKWVEEQKVVYTVGNVKPK